MKRSDIFTIISVTLVGIIVSSVLLNMLLGDPNEKSVSFKTIEVIEAGLSQPDPEVFNPDAINPTVEVYVGECVDRDQNGELDEAELIACGRSSDGGRIEYEEGDQQEESEAETEIEAIEDVTESEDTSGSDLREEIEEESSREEG